MSAFLAELTLFPKESLQEGCVSLRLYLLLRTGCLFCGGGGGEGSPLRLEDNTASKIIAVCFLQNKCNLLSGFCSKY